MRQREGKVVDGTENPTASPAILQRGVRPRTPHRTGLSYPFGGKIYTAKEGISTRSPVNHNPRGIGRYRPEAALQGCPRRRLVVDGIKPFQGEVGNRPYRAKAPLRSHHVERNPPLVQRGEKPTKVVVERVDLIEEPESIRFSPGEILPANAQKERPFGDVGIPLKELELCLGVANAPNRGLVLKIDIPGKLPWKPGRGIAIVLGKMIISSPA